MGILKVHVQLNLSELHFAVPIVSLTCPGRPVTPQSNYRPTGLVQQVPFWLPGGFVVWVPLPLDKVLSLMPSLAIVKNLLHHVSGLTVQVSERWRGWLPPAGNSILLIPAQSSDIEDRVAPNSAG